MAAGEEAGRADSGGDVSGANGCCVSGEGVVCGGGVNTACKKVEADGVTGAAGDRPGIGTAEGAACVEINLRSGGREF